MKECSRYLNCEVNPVVQLNEADFLDAVDRKLVNPKFLRLEAGALSDALVSELSEERRCWTGWSITLDAALQGKSIDELRSLEWVNLQGILECSLLRVNKSIFDITLNCMETRGCVREVMLRFLQFSDVQEALMMADALELLERMVDYVQPDNDSLFENLLVQATKFQAQKCRKYLQSFTPDFGGIPGMLEAYAYTGDMAMVKMFSGIASVDSIEIAIEEAVIMEHFEIAAFLRTEWKNRKAHSTNPDDWLVGHILGAVMWNAKRSVANRLLRDGPSDEFLTWVFEDLDDSEIAKFNRLLEDACDGRYINLFRYLVERGCTLKEYCPTLGKEDLLDFIEVRCGLKKDAPYFKLDPTIELFLLKRGIHIRKIWPNDNPVTDILWEGFKHSSFADRVDLIKFFLSEDSTFATNIAVVRLRREIFNCDWLNRSPLGSLGLFGTPRIDIWNGTNVIRYADIVSVGEEQPKSDEWNSSRPNEIEVQALQDIRAALVQHGADPQMRFEPDVLHAMMWKRDILHTEVVRQVIQGRADVNKRDQQRYSPLSRAFRTFQPIEVIEVLIDSGASVESENWSDGLGRGCDYRFVARNILWAALGTFAVVRNPDILRFLLDRKMDPNVPEENDTDGEGLSPLSWILAFNLDGKHEVADVLLQYKANINATDKRGRTAIFRAVALGDAKSVDFLIKHGADLRIADKHGVRPIDIARYGVHGEQESANKEIIGEIEKVIGETDIRLIDGHRSVRDLLSIVELRWDSSENRYNRYPKLCEFRGWIYW